MVSTATPQPTATVAPSTTATATTSPEATIETSATPTEEATIPPAQVNPVAQGDRIVISKIGVDAPLTYRVATPGQQLPNPEGALDVVIYDFSNVSGAGGAPGQGGNIVLAGHVDLATYGAAVFYYLSNLSTGDVVELYYGGEIYRYSVTTERFTVPGDGPSPEFSYALTTTSTETLTLITCEGEFNTTTREYSDRLVIRAERID